MKTRAYSETELVRRARGNIDAFGDLVERYRGSIYRQCLSRVRDAHHAEDLAQETFIRAYLKLDQLNEPMFFANWLRKIASNICSEFLRSSQRSEHVVEFIEEQVAESSKLQLGANDTLTSLPRKTRRCLELRYEQQLSYSEIAETMGVTVATVRHRLHRAKALLREGLIDLEDNNRSVFTKRVLNKLEEMKSAAPQKRARAAGQIRQSLGEDQYARILKMLKGEHPPATSPQPIMTDWELSMNVVRAIRASKKHRTPEMRDALVDLMLHHEDEEVRLKAAGALVAQRDPSAIPYLKQAMEDPCNPQEVVAAAKSSIAQLEKIEAASPSLEAHKLRRDVADAAQDKVTRVELMRQLVEATKDPIPAVRGQAAKALSELGDKRAVHALIKLIDDPQKGVREAACIALGDLGSPQAVMPLARVLDTANDRMEIQAALQAVTKLGDSRAVPAVIHLLDRFNGNNNIFHYTCECLEQIASPDNLADIRETLSRFQPSHNAEDKEYANHHWLRILAKHADHRHIPELAAVLETNATHSELTVALTRVAGEEAIPILRSQLLEHGSWPAADALVSLGAVGLGPIKEALGSERPEVRDAAYSSMEYWDRKGADAIADARDYEALQLLENLAQSETTTSSRRHAKIALRRVKKKMSKHDINL